MSFFLLADGVFLENLWRLKKRAVGLCGVWEEDLDFYETVICGNLREDNVPNIL